MPRLGGLSEQGFSMWDEGFYALEARTFASSARWALTHPVDLASGRVEGLRERLREEGGVLPNTTAKPTHLAFKTAAFTLFGDRDLSALGLSAFFGLANVLLLWHWARRRAGPWAGLAAGGLLALSGAHVWYSRIGLAVTETGFLLTLAAWAAVESRGRGRASAWAAGAVLGLAFSSSYNALPSMIAIVGAAALFSGPRHAAALAAGALAPLAAWEVFFLVRNAFSPVDLPSYLGELKQQLFKMARAGPKPVWQPGLFLEFLLASSGAAAAAVLAAGVAAALAGLRKRVGEDPLGELLPWLLGPAMLVAWMFALKGFAPVARPIGNVLPFLCLAGGLGLGRLLEAVERRLRPALGPRARLVPAGLLVLLLAPSWPAAARLAGQRFPYREAAAELAKTEGAFAASNEPILFFYEPSLRDRRVLLDERGEVREGPAPAWAMVDHGLAFNYPDGPSWLAPTLAQARWSRPLGPAAGLAFFEADPRRMRQADPAVALQVSVGPFRTGKSEK